MKRNKYLTNQELLTELKARLPNFTQDELYIFLVMIQPYQERILKIIQEKSPKVYNAIQKQTQQWEEEKNDKTVAELKKTLANK